LKTLITGVSGFVGQKLSAKLLNLGKKVIGIDLHSATFDFQKNNDFEFHIIDITDSSSISNLPIDDVDTIYHLAAAGVKATHRQWSLSVKVNVIGTITLLQFLLKRASQGKPVPRIIYTKTYYEDHLDSNPAFIENPYVLSKVASTKCLEAFSHLYPVGITIAKVFQVYGPGDDPDNVLNYAARTLKAGKVATFGLGKGLKDWIYIDDFIDGLISCGANHRAGLHNFDLGSGKCYSTREMVEILAKFLKADSKQLIFSPTLDRGDDNVKDWAIKLPPNWRCNFSNEQGLDKFLEELPPVLF
jgi:nucleoside-diphosphate-sugar epimerase